MACYIDNMAQLSIVKKTLSYAALGAVIYLSFRYLPNSNYDKREIMVMTCVSVAVYAVIDYLCTSISEDRGVRGEQSGSRHQNQDKLDQLLESFASVKNDSCSCSKPEGFASVEKPAEDEQNEADEKDNESYLKGDDENENAAANDDEQTDDNPEDDLVSRLQDENKHLKQLVQDIRNSMLDSAQRLDPTENKGHTYSTDPRNVTTVDESIPSSIRKTGKQGNGSRAESGVMKSEMVYHDHNSLPVADGYKSRAYEYGYSYLPPEKWFPQPAHPPVCVTEKESAVRPMMTVGLPADLKEWDASRRITPPANINVDYIKDKLNSGR